MSKDRDNQSRIAGSALAVVNWPPAGGTVAVSVAMAAHKSPADALLPERPALVLGIVLLLIGIAAALLLPRISTIL